MILPFVDIALAQLLAITCLTTGAKVRILDVEALGKCLCGSNR